MQATSPHGPIHRSAWKYGILRSSYTRTCIAPARRISALAEIAVGWRLSKCRDVATLSVYHHRLCIGVEIHRS